MRAPIPPAAWFFYVAAGILAALGVLVIVTGVAGASASAAKGGDEAMIGSFLGANFVIVGCFQLIGAGSMAAIGAVIHDIRRIAVNTAAFGQTAELVARLATNGGGGTATASADTTFYYFDKAGEHGPYTRTELAALMGAGAVSPYQRIEKWVGAMRLPFQPSDLS